MNDALLWVDVLLVCLLWVMGVAALVCRLRRRWIRWPLLWVGVAIPLLTLGSFLSVAIAVHSHGIANSRLKSAAMLMAAFIIGSVGILWNSRRRGPDGQPAAAHWRRGPIVLGWLVAEIMSYIILSNMDTALRARCAILDGQVNALYIAMSPAIVSESQNAANLYDKVFARFRNDAGERDIQNEPIGNSDQFDPKEPATVAFLARQAGMIALLRRAAAMPGCRFDQDVKYPNLAVLPDLNEARTAANILALDAKESLAKGDAKEAIDDCAAIFGISRHFGRRPMLVAALVGMGIDGLGNTILAEALPAVTRPEDLNGLHLESLEPFGRALQQSLWGEERYGLMCYGSIPGDSARAADGTPPNFPSPTSAQLLTASSVTGSLYRVLFLDVDAYIKLITTMQDLSTQPYYLARPQLQEMTGHDLAHGDLLTAILAPSLQRALATAGVIEARDVLATTAVAATRYRLDHGSYPAKLDDLVPAYLDAVPIDPCDGHPLRLAIKSDRWIIYSIGLDGIDDEGVERKSRDHGDIIFALRLLAATTGPVR